MADNGLLDLGTANAIERTRGVKQQGVRAGNGSFKEQANELLNVPDPATLRGKRGRGSLALLICCGLRRAEVLRLEVGSIQQREGRWVIPDLVGKGNLLRIVTVPAAVKVRIEGIDLRNSNFSNLATQNKALNHGKQLAPILNGPLLAPIWTPRWTANKTRHGRTNQREPDKRQLDHRVRCISH